MVKIDKQGKPLKRKYLKIDTLGSSGVVGGYWIPIMTICRSEGSGLHQPPPNTKAR